MDLRIRRKPRRLINKSPLNGALILYIMSKKITLYNNFEEMNDADVALILDKSEDERIKYFKQLLTQFNKPDSFADAFREYHKWMSLLDDKYIK